MGKNTKKVAIGIASLVTIGGIYWYCNRVSISINNIDKDRRTLDYIVIIGSETIKGTASINQKRAIKEQYNGKTLSIFVSEINKITITVSDKNNVILKTQKYVFPPIGIIPYGGLPDISRS